MASSSKRLRERLKSQAWRILSRLPEQIESPVKVKATSEARVVSIQVGPVAANGESQGPPGFPGLHFSPIEAAIWQCLASGTLVGKQIAKAISQHYSPRLKVLLHNMVDREILSHGKDGYTRRSSGIPQSQPRDTQTA